MHKYYVHLHIYLNIHVLLFSSHHLITNEFSQSNLLEFWSSSSFYLNWFKYLDTQNKVYFSNCIILIKDMSERFSSEKNLFLAFPHFRKSSVWVQNLCAQLESRSCFSLGSALSWLVWSSKTTFFHPFWSFRVSHFIFSWDHCRKKRKKKAEYQEKQLNCTFWFFWRPNNNFLLKTVFLFVVLCTLKC